MRNLPSILAAAALLIVLLLYMCTFQVRSTEVGVRKTFGNADRNVIGEAGLYFKWPWPVQSVVKYDKRLRILTDRTEETRTADSKNIILTTFAVWTIADPYKFHVTYPDEEAGRKALRTKIRSHKMAVTGKYDFSEFVSTDPGERKLPQIEGELMALISDEAKDEFGVDIKMFGIKQLGLPEEVTKSVFESMKTTEETKAENYKAEGEAKAAEIVASATAARQRILAVTKRKVDEIRSRAQGEEAKIYEAFREHQDLRIFLDKLAALEEVLKTRTTLILDPATQPIDLFDEGKRLTPASSQVDTALSTTVERVGRQAQAD
ncbi:MAG: SPFH domain-containing protein [Planctomycetota bacterium]|jgi:membrane protease subunit HflC